MEEREEQISDGIHTLDGTDAKRPAKMIGHHDDGKDKNKGNSPLNTPLSTHDVFPENKKAQA